MTSQLRSPPRDLMYQRVTNHRTSLSGGVFELSSNFAGQSPNQSEVSLCKSVVVKSEERSRQQHDLWSPLILKRRSLWSFIVVFISLTTIIIGLWVASNRGNGLLSVESDHHYLWTYGPTAVFTILSAIWGQVEYRTLQLLPWRSMRNGYVPASQSVLLDYLSDWNVWALIRSLKKKHFMVTIAVGVSLLLKLLTAFSTGLFTTMVVQVDKDVDLTLNTIFDGSGFNSSAVDARSYMQSWGSTNRGLRYPAGTLSDDDGYHAFQTIYNVLPNHTFHANVDVVTPRLYCVEAEAITNGSSQAVTLQTNDCSVDIPPDDATTSFRYLELILASCNGELQNATDWRLWTYVAVDSNSQQGQPVSNDVETVYVNFVALMCTPSYSTSRGFTTWIGTSDTSQPEIRIENKTQVEVAALGTVKPSDLLFAAHQSAKSAVLSFVEKSTNLMYLDIGIDTTSRETLHNIRKLNDTLVDRTNSYTVQVINNYLLREAEDHITGTTTTPQMRLVLRELSVWIMVSILLTITVVALIFVLYYLPIFVCSRDPGTIAGLATFLANSPALKTSLFQKGSATNKELKQALKTASFSYNTDRSGLDIRLQDEKLSVPEPVFNDIRWWRPMSASWWFRATTIFIPIVLFIVLEILYRDSKSHQGIVDILLGSTMNAGAVYIPALVFLAVRTLFESVYFTARIFQPYYNLKQGHAQPSTSVLSNQHRDLAVVGVWNSLRQKQWPILAAGIAVLVGPLLPIVVSGLYIVNNIPASTQLSLKQLNRINMTDGCFMCNAADDQKSWAGNLILEFNASYPRWTYEQWSFPKVIANDNNTSAVAGKSSNTTAQVLDDSSILVRLPALHIDLPCVTTPIEDYEIGFSQRYSDEGDIISVNFTQMNGHDPTECGFDYDNTFFTQIPAASGYFGIWGTPINWPSYSDCSPIVVIYGQVSSNASSVETATVVQCRPQVKQTDIDVNLKASTYDIDLTTPPVSVSGSSKILYDGDMDFYASEPGYLPKQDILGSLLPDLFFVLDNTDQMNSLGNIFRSMASGVNGVGQDALLDSTVLMSSLQHTIGIFMAQILSSTGYEDYSLNETAVAVADRPTHVGTLTYPYKKRLVQTEISTRILQAILLVMCICGAISMMLMNTKKVLPKNPMSIAALASLLADSKMATRRDVASGGLVPADEYEEQQTTLDEIYGGRTYSMGWLGEAKQGFHTIEDEVTESNRRSDRINEDDIVDEEGVLRKRIYRIDAD